MISFRLIKRGGFFFIFESNDILCEPIFDAAVCRYIAINQNIMEWFIKFIQTNNIWILPTQHVTIYNSEPDSILKIPAYSM